VPVVESYPSIVGIAEVAQAAGQGRYNQWLAEFNTRSNVAKTNAMMSGFSAGANVGMSALRMMQQQQQFTQRQGFIESQATDKLKADTDHAAAMMPALDPWVQMKFPHLTAEQRGAYIGSLNRNQVDEIVNSQSNAGQALAWHNKFRSPMAMARQAEDTYNNAISGKKHHNARVQARLEPILQRVRDADLDYVDGAVYDEIARILKEEGEAKPGGSRSSEWYENAVVIRDPNTGKPVAYTWRDQQNKTHTYTLPKVEAVTTLTQPETWEQRHKLNTQIGSRHAQMVSEWESRYASAPAYEGDKPQVPTKDVALFSQADATGRVRHWRQSRVEDSPTTMRLQRGDMFYTETNIPPRPTWDDAVRQFPGAAAYLGEGQAVGGPRMQPQPQPQGQVVRPTRPGGVMTPGQDPGQAMPTPVPVRARRPGLAPALVPSPGGMAEYGSAGIEERGRVTPGETIQPEEIELGRSAVRKRKAQVDAKGAAIKKLRKDYGNAGQRGLTELIGAGQLRPTETTQNFEAVVRSGQPLEPLTSQLMLEAEHRELNKRIKGFDAKISKGRQLTEPGKDQTVSGLGQGVEMARDRSARENLTKRELDIYYQVRGQFAERREYIGRIAQAAVLATPPGERVDIGNIPNYTMQEFDLGVSRGQIRVGEVILSGTKGIHFVDEKDILDSKDRMWKLRGVPLRGIQ